MSAKRSGPRTPENRPLKRRATSSPEEGEVDDSTFDIAGPATSHPLPPKPALAAAGSLKFKVPFPFKKSVGSQNGSVVSLPSEKSKGGDRMKDRDRDRRRQPAVYERPEENERQFRQGGNARRNGVSDSYVPGPGSKWYQPEVAYSTSTTITGDSYVPPRERSRSRSRERQREHRRDRHQAPNNDYERRRYQGPSSSPTRRPLSPRRPSEPSALTPSEPHSPRSPPRAASPLSRSSSPSSRSDQRQRHRLPTPRSKAAILPSYRERESVRPRERDREADRSTATNYSDPYGRDYYRDRDRDPRGQYFREEVDDWDRHYRPSGYDERGYSRYPHSPVYRPMSPPRRAFDGPRTPYGPPPSRTPPPPPPSNVRSSANAPHPLPPSSSETLRAREAQELAMVRPGAPRQARSPPAMPDIPPPSQKATPAASSLSQPSGTSAPTMTIRKRRAAVKRTREQEKAAYQRVFVGCGSRDDYDVMTKLGEGTFGEVHKALHRTTRQVVALKRIMMHNEKEGMPVTALREIKILKMLDHPCIVELLDMFVIPSKGKESPMSVYMVFPYMDHDLAGLLENERVKLTPSQIKLYMKQLLEGTEYMHHNNILHRDMKAANLLISNNGSLKIADFGLARAFSPKPGPEGRERRYTNCVVTRWYRPPELLLGARSYGGEVDIWGIGCVLGEMFMRRPILPGSSDLDQLEKIWSICGSPNQQNWPDYDHLPGCEGQIRFRPQERRIKIVYDSLGRETCALLDRMLTLDPRERITASQALDHEYFWSDPLPADPKTLPSYEASHEFDQRGRRHVQPVPTELAKAVPGNIGPLALGARPANAPRGVRVAPLTQFGPYVYVYGDGPPDFAPPQATPSFRPPNQRAPPNVHHMTNAVQHNYNQSMRPDAPPQIKQLRPLPAGLPARPSGPPPPLGIGRNQVPNGGGTYPRHQRRTYDSLNAGNGPQVAGGELNYG